MTNPPLPPVHSLAVASLVFAFLVPPLGIALGAIARGEIQDSGARGLALATLAMVVGCVLSGLVLLVAVGAAAGFALLVLLYSGAIPWY